MQSQGFDVIVVSETWWDNSVTGMSGETDQEGGVAELSSV